jgi:hypothetical protein
MVLSVVSRSGSCEPRIAKPKGKGSAVPRIRDVPAVAIVAWVIAIIGEKKGTLLLTSVSLLERVFKT